MDLGPVLLLLLPFLPRTTRTHAGRSIGSGWDSPLVLPLFIDKPSLEPGT